MQANTSPQSNRGVLRAGSKLHLGAGGGVGRIVQRPVNGDTANLTAVKTLAWNSIVDKEKAKKEIGYFQS